MLDFGLFPPELNSGLMYSGPGSGSMLAAAAAWDGLASDLYSTASSYSSVISDLTSGWQGPSSMSMAAAAAPYVSWMSATAAQAEQTGAQAQAAAGAYETAFSATVPPGEIAANRSLLMALIATNFFGQNTPGIMATEAQYMEMWAQDAMAMYSYLASSLVSMVLDPFTTPLQITNPAGLLGQVAALAQAVTTGAGTGAQTVSPLSTAMSTPLGAMLPTPLTAAAAPNAVPGLASTASTSPLSSVTALTSSPAVLTSGTSLASGTGTSATMATSGISMLGSAGALMNSVSPASMFGNPFQAVITSGPGVFSSPGLGSAAMTAGMGRAASLGVLSVPQGWTSAAPAFSQVSSVLPGTSGLGVTPSVVPAGPQGLVPPLANMAGRGGMSTELASAPRFDVRPTVVQRPVYAG
jgi:PPE-repeat protein